MGWGLRVESRADGVGLRFEVRDTGIGISEAQQRKIFEAFGQADSSTTRQFGGTGLGLSIAGQLVQLMGGELAVSSEMGRGSRFYFTAPFAIPDSPEPATLQPVELRGLRALVVDDNDTSRMILEELLASWGMQAHCVADVREAMAVLDRSESPTAPFSVALLDVSMPQTDGFELAALIRQRPALAALRILMLTSAGRRDTETLREQLDISRVLLKPIKHSTLQQAISEALGASPALGSREPRDDGPAAQPRQILLAEDNAVNRRVAMEVLGRRGHRIRVATNGREAVEMTSREEFDLVLMDVHMPVMDGLTATRIIREREHNGGEHTAIVALTAGATLQDRENCLSAGMDGFVSKPFRAAELIQSVESFRPETPWVSAAGEPASDGESTAGEPCLDWHSALRNLEGDEDFLRELSEMFLHQYPAMLTPIAAAVDSAAGDELQHAAHALKGSAQVIGGKAVAALARKLEMLGRTGRAAEARPALQGLERRLGELSEALQAELSIK